MAYTEEIKWYAKKSDALEIHYKLSDSSLSDKEKLQVLEDPLAQDLYFKPYAAYFLYSFINFGVLLPIMLSVVAVGVYERGKILNKVEVQLSDLVEEARSLKLDLKRLQDDYPHVRVFYEEIRTSMMNYFILLSCLLLLLAFESYIGYKTLAPMALFMSGIAMLFMAIGFFSVTPRLLTYSLLWEKLRAAVATMPRSKDSAEDEARKELKGSVEAMSPQSIISPQNAVISLGALFFFAQPIIQETFKRFTEIMGN